MATENVNQTAQAGFFEMGGKYLIDAGNTPGTMMNDASCLLKSALGVLDDTHGELSDAHWAVYYLIQQAKGMYDHAQKLMIRSGSIDS